MKKILFFILIFLLLFIPIYGNTKTSELPESNFSNVVFFAYFKGTAEEEANDIKYFKDNTNKILDIYNSTTSRSFTNYLSAISYGKFNVKNIFPQLKNGVIEPVRINDTIDNYYLYNKDTALFDYILGENYVTNYELDYNNDGFVDNITIIVKGRSGHTAVSESTFVSHKSNYPNTKKYNNKYIGTCNIVSTDSVDSSGPGVLAHEFLHSIGYPDLYRGKGEDDIPVGVWDIMAKANSGLPYPLAYLRSSISNWIDIETITESTNSLRLDLQSNPNGNHAYILKSPFNEYELFVVEYRKKTSSVDPLAIDVNIGRSGIIVYRVNTTVEGLSNNFGKTGIYVFRPKSYGNENSNNFFASLAANVPMSGITDRINTIGKSDLSLGLSDGALTFSDGSNSGIVIKNVSKTDGDYMTFDVEIPEKGSYDLWEESNLNDLTSSTNYTKAMEITSHNEKLYAISIDYKSGDSKLYTQVLDNNWVTKNTTTINLNSYLADQKVIEYNNKLYLLYSDGTKLVLNEWDDTNNKWVVKSTITKSDLRYMGVTTANNKLYITFLAEDSGTFPNMYNNLYLYEYSSSGLKQLGSKSVKQGGQPKVAVMNNKIYLTSRDASGTIEFFLYENGNFTEIPNTYSAYSYDIKTLNNKMYLVLGSNTDENLNIYVYDGTKFSTISTSVSISNPILTISQGNLYLVANESNSIVAYSFDEVNKKLNKEGHTVDTSGNAIDSTLVSIKDTLYVSIKRGTDNKFIVKKKETVNKLLSLSITPPKKVSYVKGDAIDKTGLKVLANYTLGPVEVTNYTISNFNTTTVGIHTATITYEGVSNTFTYEVFEDANVLLSLTLTPPTKTSYKIGEAINKTGLKVIANYSKGSVEVTNYTISGFSTTNIGSYKATVAYGGLTKTFNYTVVANTTTTTTTTTTKPTTKSTTTTTTTKKPTTTTTTKKTTTTTTTKKTTTTTKKPTTTTKPITTTTTTKKTTTTTKPISTTTTAKKETLVNMIIKNNYKIKTNYVHGFAVNTSINTLKSKFNGVNIKTTNTIIATGTEFIYNNEKYITVLYGDLNNDGKINSADLLKMRQHLLGTSILNGASKEAAYITNTNQINSANLLKLRQYLLGTTTINQ